MFLHQLLREMRKGGANGEGGLGESTATQLTRDLSDETLARHMAQGSSLGLGNMLYKQLAPLANQAQVHPRPTDKSGREVHP